MSERKKLDAQLASLKEAYTGTVVKAFKWDKDERQLSLRIEVEGRTFRFGFYIPEDFPDFRPMISVDDGEESEELEPLLAAVGEYCEKPTASIGSIIHRLLNELSKVVEFRVPRVGALSLSRSRNIRKSAATGNAGGEAEEGSDEEYFDDEDYLDGVDDAGEEKSKLMRHGEVVMSLYGTDTIQVYPFIDSVRIQLDVAPLNSEVQKKMGVDPEYHSKIVLSTQFGSGDYMADKRIPQVKVIHPKAKGKADEEVKCGLGEQMENVARQFMERVWNSLHVEHEGRPVQKLMAMGWDKNTCQFAWETCNYDYEAAVSWLSDNVPLLRGLNTESSSSSASSTPVLRDKKSKGKSSIKSTKKDKGKGKGKDKEKDKEKEKKESKKDKKTSKKLKRKKSTPKTSRAITPAVKEQQALVTRKKEKLENYFTKDCHQLGVAIALTQNNMDVEKACNQILDAGGSVEGIQLLSDPQETFKDRNMLLELTTYLVRRLPNCIGYCLICDKRIINEEITDPTICTIGTCQFNYIELGVCDSIPMTFCPSSISNDILNNPDVVDLYISMIVAAATSHRKGDIFDPFPPFYESHGTKQYDEVVRVLDMVPSVDDMKKRCGSEKELITYLSSIDNNGAIYRLLSWILSVNRSAMLLLPPNLQLEAMRTKHQYMLTAETNPTKTATFKAWRKQYGSYFAFHGSGIENWHSILRKGLLNCSGTKLQTTGQAYGPGVYLAPDSATSMGYARTGRAWSKSRFGDSSSLTCMAIAEVVKHPDVPHTPNPYYVVRNADCVATRFFLFYPGGNSGVNVQAKDLNLDKYV